MLEEDENPWRGYTLKLPDGREVGVCHQVFEAVVAPGLRVGRGLEHTRGARRVADSGRCARPSGRARIGTPWRGSIPPSRLCRCARPSGRARIGTRSSFSSRTRRRVAPGLRVGRGLEHARQVEPRPAVGVVAPGLRVGRGLELRNRTERTPVLWLRPAFGSGEDWNSMSASSSRLPRRCARPSGRARIGTALSWQIPCPASVAPGLRVGRGLEPLGDGLPRPRRNGAPEPPERRFRHRCARPSGRARIGTVPRRRPPSGSSGCARPSGRARIGTTRGR